MSQIIVGFCTEGPTDVRFLESIIQRTFEEISFECRQQIEILPIQHIPNVGGSFVESKMEILQKATNLGVMVFCIHIDADEANDANVFQTRINPLITAINLRTALCNNIVPIIPVYMTESWMLADRELLKEELGTMKSYQELGISRRAEDISDPKAILSSAINLAHADFPKRRRHQLSVSDLYRPIGQKIDLKQLRTLHSFQKFETAVRQAFIKMNYL